MLSNEELDIFKIRTISWLFHDEWKWFINSDSEDVFDEYKKFGDLPSLLIEGFENLTEEIFHVKKGVMRFKCDISNEDEDTITADVKVIYPNRTVQKYMRFEKE